VAAGAYVTDGVDLFAVLSVSGGLGPEPLVTFEDCRTLELLTCTLGEFERDKSELVRGAASAQPEPARHRSPRS
jgi:hypothetical protein